MSRCGVLYYSFLTFFDVCNENDVQNENILFSQKGKLHGNHYNSHE